MRSRSLLSVVALTFAISLLLHASPCCLVAAREAAGTGSEAGPSGSSGSSSNSKVASDLLKQGTAAMASGRFAAAITSFDEAIAADPKAYLTYYRRATAELSLGKTSAALADLDHLLTLKPDFAQAHFSRANVLTKEGELEKAQEAIDAFLKLKSSDGKGQELKNKIETGRKQLKLLQAAFDSIEKGMSKGKDVQKDRQLHAKAEDCIKAAEKVLEISPNNLEARSKRAECRLALGLVEDAMADWSRIVNLAPSTELLLRLSSLKYYITGSDLSSREAGMSHLKSCLSSDPDNKRCARAHRRLRGIEKQIKKAEKFAEGNNWRPVISALKGAKVGGNTVIADVEAAIKADVEAGDDGTEAVIPSGIKDAVERSGLLLYLRQLHCRAHTELNEAGKAKPFCEAVLARDPDYPWALVSRADSLMKEEKYEEAMRDYQTALEKSGGQEESIQRKLQKAQRLHKQANSKDYYKILGVSRDADGPTIKRAYRKLAKQHHPDKGGTAEKMASLNEAFDVLNDSEKRAQFDQGVDPNDPMAQAQAQHGGGFPGGGGHPFVFQQGGGHPFSHFFQQQQHFAGGGGGGGGPRFSFDF